MKKFCFILFTLSLSTLHAGEEAWDTFERLTNKNNNKSIKGEMLHNYRGYKSEEVTLNIQIPKHIQIVNASGMELLRLESDRVNTGQPKIAPTLAKAWDLLLDVKRSLASVTNTAPTSFFHYYKSSSYFDVKSNFDDPFQVIEMSSSDKKVPFRKLEIYFDNKDRLSTLRIQFKNGLSGSFTRQSAKDIKAPVKSNEQLLTYNQKP